MRESIHHRWVILALVLALIAGITVAVQWPSHRLTENPLGARPELPAPPAPMKLADRRAQLTKTLNTSTTPELTPGKSAGSGGATPSARPVARTSHRPLINEVNVFADDALLHTRNYLQLHVEKPRLQASHTQQLTFVGDALYYGEELEEAAPLEGPADPTELSASWEITDCAGKVHTFDDVQQFQAPNYYYMAGRLILGEHGGQFQAQLKLPECVANTENPTKTNVLTDEGVIGWSVKLTLSFSDDRKRTVHDTWEILALNAQIPVPETVYAAAECSVDPLGQQVPQSLMADPVNTATGAFTETVTDVSLPGRVPLTLQRTYSSAARDREGLWGHGWSSAFSARIEGLKGSRDTATLITGSGSAIPLERSGGFLRAPDWFTGRIEREGSEFVVTTSRGDVYRFNSRGRLLAMLDRAGEGLEFHYTDDRLHTVQATTGYRITLTWKQSRVSRITLPDETSIEYDYTDGLLTEVRGIRKGSERYAYDDKQRLTTVTDGAGERVLSNKYDSQDRVTAQTHADGEVTRFVYDESVTHTISPGGGIWSDIYRGGVLIAQYDPYGDATQYRYNSTLQVVSVRDAAGGETRFEYNEDGQKVAEVSPEGVTTEYSYTPQGQVEEVSLDGQRQYAYEYTEEGYLASHTDAEGHTTSYTYTARGELTRMRSAEGRVSEFEHNKHGVVRRVRRGESSTTYTLDAAGRVVVACNAAGQSRFYGYDSHGRTLWEMLPGGFTRAYEYDAAGRVRSQHERPYPSSVFARTTRYQYRDGRLKSVIDPAGRETRYRYNARGQLQILEDAAGYQQAWVYDHAGRLSAEVSARGRVRGARAGSFTTRYTYDTSERTTTITRPGDAVTTLTRSADGKLLSHVDAAGAETRYSYTSQGKIESKQDAAGSVQRFSYTPSGRLARSTDPLGRTTQYEYDQDGLLSHVETPAGRAVSYSYDDLGRRSSVTDPAGNTETYEYDAAGYLVRVTNPAGGERRFTYDAAGNMTARRDEAGRSTRWKYNAFGELSAVIDATGQKTRYFRDSHTGSVLTKRDALGRVTRYGYDVLDRVVSLRDPLERETVYAYDAEHNLTGVRDPRGVSTVHSYDQRGNLTRTQYSDGTSGIRFGYDGGDRVTQAHHKGQSRRFSYDKRGNLREVNDGEKVLARYGYDAASQLTSRELGNSRETFAYSPDGELVQRDRDGQVSQYGYHATGALSSVTLPTGHREERRYDSRGYLSDVAHRDPAGDVRQRWEVERSAAGEPTLTRRVRGGEVSETVYAYDKAGRLTQEGDVSYEYDAVGNRTSVKAGEASRSFEYDAADQLVASSVRDGGQTTRREYEYDAAGNRIRGPDGEVDYDALGRPTRVDVAGEPIRISYGVFGAPTVGESADVGVVSPVSTPPHTAEVTYNPAGEVETRDGAAFLHGPFGNPATQIATDESVTDADASAFGAGETLSTGLGGYKRLTDTLLVSSYRLYDTEAGQFTSPDPAAVSLDDPAVSTYCYSRNSPTTRFDPDGATSIPLLDASGSRDVVGTAEVNSKFLQELNTGPFEGVGNLLDTLVPVRPFLSDVINLGYASSQDCWDDIPVHSSAVLLSTAALATSVTTPGSGVVTRGGARNLTRGEVLAKRAGVSRAGHVKVPSKEIVLYHPPGEKVYRVYGGDSKASGASWSPVDPRRVMNYRDAAGLPSGGASGATNSGRFVIEGELVDSSKVVLRRDALPLDGMEGGLREYIIPNWRDNGAVRISRVSGVNPEF